MATPIALAIAGSEASGRRRAQTDLKTFHELGVFGCTALTCIVSFDPNNNWGHRFVPVDPQVIADQIEAAASVHSHIDAVKIGMLGTPATIEVVSQALDTYKFPQVGAGPGTDLQGSGARRGPGCGQCSARTGAAQGQHCYPEPVRDPGAFWSRRDHQCGAA